MATKQEAIRSVLDSHFVFSSLAEPYKQALEKMFEIEKYAAGELIADSGKTVTGMYSVYSGTVRFKTLNEEGKRISLGEQPEGTTFGEICLLRDERWDRQVVAATDVILLKLPAKNVRDYARQQAALEQHLQRQIGGIELRKRLQDILGSARVTPEEAAELVSGLGMKSLKKGGYAFRQGDTDPKAQRLHYVITGSIELVRDMVEGSVVLEKIGPGTLFNEEAALRDQPPTYSAAIVADATVLVIGREQKNRLLELSYELKQRLEDRSRQLRERERSQANAFKRAEGVDQRYKVEAISEREFKAVAGRKEIEKFKVVHQHDESECVPACLTMVVRQYGKNFSLGQIRELANIQTTTATLPQVCNAAEVMGLRAKPYRVGFDDLSKLQLPLLILWENYHYAVLYRVSGNRVYIADPEAGLKEYDRKEFETGWDNVVVVMEPTQRFQELEQPKSAVRFFLRFLTPYTSFFAEAFLAAMVMNMLGLASPIFVQNIVDKVVVHNDKSLLNMMLAGMALATIFRLITGAAQSLLIAHTINRIDMRMMAEFYQHILSLPAKFFSSRQPGDILARFGENQKIRGILAGSTISMVLNSLMIVIYIAMMWVYSGKLTLLVLIFVPIYIANTLFFTPKLKELANQLFFSSSQSQSHLIEALQGWEALKATANEYWARARWEDSFVERVNLGYRSAKVSLLFDTISQLINLSSSIVILWVGANLVMEPGSTFTIGSLMGFNMLMGAVMGPIMGMVGLWGSFQEIRIAMDRVSDIYNIKPEQLPVSTPDRMPVMLPRCEGRIEFRNVRFRYGGEESPLVLNNLNLTIEPGQTVALVGPSGCGKSTVIKMIMGFNMPTSGECLIDGKDLMALELGAYRRHLGVVLQDSFLFSDTVAGNIALGDTEPDMNMVREAARLSSADDFIVQLPLGYQTMMGQKGIPVSGGQRQRICIGRALYRQPKILIFDEATSALDNESEARIQQNMRSILSGRTAVVIAHRLSTVRDADYICFMDKGTVAEKGSHDELVAMKGRYYQMAKKQFNLD